MDTQQQISNVKKSSFLSGGLVELRNRKQATAYLFMFLTFFTVAFFGFFVLRPALSTISKLQKQLKDNTLVFEKLQKKLATIQNLDRQYQTIQTDIPLVNAAIPNTPQIPLFTRQVETIAQNNRVILQNFIVAPIEIYPLENGNFSFTLAAVGTQQNIGSFVEELSIFSRVITIDKISTGKTKPEEAELLMSGKSYFGTR